MEHSKHWRGLQDDLRTPPGPADHDFKHPDRPGIVVVPHPKKDLGVGLLKAIRHQAGI